MFHDAFIAAIRTGVATLVALLVTFFVAQGIELPEGFEGAMTAGLLALMTALYNYAVILLEKHVSPTFGYLLGVPKAPTYEVKGPSK